jgi:hypothetical protein
MLPYFLLSLELLTMRQATVGTQLHVRLTTTVGTYASKAGDAISAVLIAPVTINGETVLPAESKLTGTVKAAGRVGLGILRETATLQLQFTEVTLPDGETFPISVRLEDVDNSREHVYQDGSIRGVRGTSSMSYRVSGYIRTALSWELHAGLAFWAVQTLIVQVPEPEIYYPAGVELTLSLTRPLVPSSYRGPERVSRTLTEEERSELEPIIAELPYRAYTPSMNRPSDLVNVMLIGSRDQIASAFIAAGWTEARPTSIRSVLRGTQAVAEGRGFGAAPMSPLLLNQALPDMSWQKSLNDVSKRHHIRIWKQAATWDGKEVWMGSASRDIDFAYLRTGGRFTHQIEANVDLEREKIVNDLEFTSCTGDPMITDGALAVLGLNDCVAPRQAGQTGDSTVLRAHGNPMQRLLRRQILSARSDYLRTNIYWRGYEGTRWAVATLRKRAHKNSEPEQVVAKSSGRLQRFESFAGAPFSRESMGWLW